MKELKETEDMEVITPVKREDLTTDNLWLEHNATHEQMTALQHQAMELHMSRKGDPTVDEEIERDFNPEIARLSARCKEIHNLITEREIKQRGESVQDEAVHSLVNKKFKPDTDRPW